MLKKYFDSIENKRREQRRRERSRNRKRVATAFAVGSLLSGISALLFAPKSGKELRKDIADKTVEGAEFVKKNAVAGYEKASKFTGEVYENAKNAIQKVVHKGEEVAEEVTEEVAETAKKTKKSAE